MKNKRNILEPEKFEMSTYDSDSIFTEYSFYIIGNDQGQLIISVTLARQETVTLRV